MVLASRFLHPGLAMSLKALCIPLCDTVEDAQDVVPELREYALDRALASRLNFIAQGGADEVVVVERLTREGPDEGEGGWGERLREWVERVEEEPSPQGG